MHAQVLKVFKSRPGQVAIAIPHFAPALSNYDDSFPEDAEAPLDAEALLAGDASEDPLAGLGDGAVAGLTFAMEYCDSKNAITRRRVTLFGFRATDGGNYLMRAFCHERKALRSFRTDRIVRVIDWDGVIYELVDYFDDLGIKLPLSVEPGPARLASAKPGEAQRALCADELCVLAALSRSDGRLHDFEVERILEFAADTCDRKGVSFAEADRAALERYVRRLRPDVMAIGKSLVQLKRRNDTAADKRLLRAMIAVMDADEMQSPDEIVFVTEVLDQLESKRV